MRPVNGAKWMLDVECGSVRKRIKVEPVKPCKVIKEKYESIPEFSPSAASWAQGMRLQNICAFECSAYESLVPESLLLEDEKGKPFTEGKDYACNPKWATVGRIANGRISPDTPVFITYSFYRSRLDSVVLTPDGDIAVRHGIEHIGTPFEPTLKRGEKRLGNIYFTGYKDSLTEDMLYPVQTRRFLKSSYSGCASALLPKTMKKLNSGKKLNILAWGDSVTNGGYLPSSQRYQNYFAAMLRKRYPASDITMNTLGWGGRTTRCYFGEPAGSEYNYEEHVLATKPDLVISEFVNDAGLPPDVFIKNYERILADFRACGIEWIILTPHYIIPSWMKLDGQKNIDDDPREYVKFLRDFAKKNSIALADASARYGQLWRHGIPYMIYMTNTINHPDRRGMKLFANTLMELFD